MHRVTGDREAVLRLMKETIDHLGSTPSAKRGVRAASTAAKGPSTEQKRVVQELDDAYKRANGTGRARVAGAGRTRAASTGQTEQDWYVPRDRTVAVFQAAMDEYLNEQVGPVKGTGSTKKGTTSRAASAAKAPPRAGATTLESFHLPAKKGRTTATAIAPQFSTLDPRWITVVWEKAKLLLKGNHKFIVHKSVTDFRFAMANETRIAIVGDWGGGNAAAQAVAKQIAKLAPDHVIHLGDVYYAGTPTEVKERFLKFWPKPASPGKSFALNSNHEMYSGGYGYFDLTLPAFKQPASYFSLANDHWRLIGLDTGYIDHDLNDAQTEWLLAQFEKPSPKTILLSHHQLFSAFENADTSKLRARVDPLLKKKRIYGWIWGHEHLCVRYAPNLGTKAICLGNGCFPYNAPKSKPKIGIEWMETRTAASDPDFRGTHTFAMLTLKGPAIKLDFINQDGDSAGVTTWT